MPHISIRGELYERLVKHVGKREKGSRGRISKTVDKLLVEYLDTQQAPNEAAHEAKERN